MASTLALNETWRCQIQAYCNSQVSFNVVDLIVTAVAGSGSTDVALAAAYDAVVAPFYKSLMNASATYQGVKVWRLNPKATAIPQVSDANTGLGTLGTANTLVSTIVCAVCSKYSAVYGRGRIGRIFMPFLDETQTRGNVLSVAAQTSYNTFLADALPTGGLSVGAGGNTATLVPVISQLARAGDNPRPFVANRVINYQTDIVLGSMKKRGPHGRLNYVPAW